MSKSKSSGFSGGSSKSKKSSGVIVMSEQEFLGLQGVAGPVSDFNIDKWKLPHGETARKRKARIKAGIAAKEEYAKKRGQARADYKALVDSGRVRPPSRVESLLKTAKGNPDNESVLAARRMLKKRGYDWKTGKRL